MKKNRLFQMNITFLWLVACNFLLLISGCVKVEYSKIKEPAYLRVFNNLNYVQTLGSKDNKVPFSVCSSTR